MSEIKYGHREGPGRGREMPVAADQYFGRLGGHFVYVDSSGNVNLCATPDGAGGTAVGYNLDSAASTVYGWLVTPKDADLKVSWKSSSTAGKDKCFVITGLEDVFVIPGQEAAASSAQASHIGQGAACVGAVNATYGRIQQGLYRGTSASTCLTIVDVDTTNNLLYVKMKPVYKQG